MTTSTTISTNTNTNTNTSNKKKKPVKRSSPTDDNDNDNDNDNNSKEPLTLSKRLSQILANVPPPSSTLIPSYPPPSSPPPLTPKTLRLVPPYVYPHSTFCKGRWVGKALLTMLSDEFRTYPSSYYALTIRRHLLLVNGLPASPDYVLKQGDAITNLLHRHEVRNYGRCSGRAALQ